MKKILLIIGILAFSATGCYKDDAEAVKPVINKVADMVYEVAFDTYSEEPVGTFDEFSGEMGCSSVRNGNYHGRNFDYFMNQSSTFVVRTSAKDGRYATIGVARLANVNDAMIDAGLSDRQISILPWALADGINEKGLVVNANVVAKADEGEIPHTGTNPGAPELNILFLIRALLDHCATVGEALDYLDARNITPLGSETMNLHIMISDPKETYVVEIINNRIVAKPQAIMTNFFVNLDTMQDYSIGVERYGILSEHYSEGGDSMEGMWNLMKRVRYTDSYYAENKWYTDLAATVGIIYQDIPSNYDLLDEMLREEEAEWETEKEYLENHGFYEDTLWWDTAHNSIYDIKNKELWVTVHERYGQIHKFSL